MNTKGKGWRSENKARRLLESMGYTLVVRSGASLGLFDLLGIGVDKSNVLLVQVKTNRRPGSKELDLLKAYLVPKFCRKELWIFKDRVARPEIIEL